MSGNMHRGIRIDFARPDHVDEQSTPLPEKIGTKQIVRIFVGDDEEYAEVSREQVDRVRAIHKRIKSGAMFSFNYNTLILVASILAGLGLVMNSTTNIIASMLVSPLMGPVVGLAYGATIRDWQLIWLSLRTETLSLLFCIAMGFLIGGITGPTVISDDWPTSEMESRGQLTNFIVALPVAFFSGLGVAVSLLDDQTAPLVGVAISASLLPPAVNAGILWIAYVFTKNNVIVSGTGTEDEYPTVEQYRKHGLLSLFLTLANILLIMLSGMLMFRIKEVLPIRKQVFWDDLGVARKIYQRKALMRFGASGDLVRPGESNVPISPDAIAAAVAVASAHDGGVTKDAAPQDLVELSS